MIGIRPLTWQRAAQQMPRHGWWIAAAGKKNPRPGGWTRAGRQQAEMFDRIGKTSTRSSELGDGVKAANAVALVSLMHMHGCVLPYPPPLFSACPAGGASARFLRYAKGIELFDHGDSRHARGLQSTELGRSPGPVVTRSNAVSLAQLQYGLWRLVKSELETLSTPSGIDRGRWTRCRA